MDKLIYTLAVAVVVAVAVAVAVFANPFAKHVVAKDGNSYIIRNASSPEIEQETANILAEINTRITKLLNCGQNQQETAFLNCLKRRWDANIISEAATSSNLTTFTVNKKYIHVCTRSDNGFYDINLLVYVFLHELAHLCNYSDNGVPITGHGPEFTENFKFLVKKAVECGIYTIEDYNASPREYCGMTIDSQVHL